MLQKQQVASAILGASRPGQVRDRGGRGGLDAETMARIAKTFVDDEHGDLVERDPAKVATPFDVMPAWKAA